MVLYCLIWSYRTTFYYLVCNFRVLCALFIHSLIFYCIFGRFTDPSQKNFSNFADMGSYFTECNKKNLYCVSKSSSLVLRAAKQGVSKRARALNSLRARSAAKKSIKHWHQVRVRVPDTCSKNFLIKAIISNFVQSGYKTLIISFRKRAH